MPGRDRRGPMGMGPNAGRAAGNCADQPVPSRGSGRGRLRGRRRHRRTYATGRPGWGRSEFVHGVPPMYRCGPCGFSGSARATVGISESSNIIHIAVIKTFFIFFPPYSPFPILSLNIQRELHLSTSGMGSYISSR